MRYAEAQTFGGSEQIQFFESPDPVASGSTLLIEVQSAGINSPMFWREWGVYPSRLRYCCRADMTPISSATSSLSSTVVCPEPENTGDIK